MQEERVQVNDDTQPQEIDHADWNAGGQMLSEAEGEDERGGDLPKLHRPSPQQRETIKANKKARTKAIRANAHLNAAQLAVLAPPAEQRTRQVDAHFMQAVADRIILYRYDALAALRDLALMPISPNSMQNNVKFLAAARLLGKETEAPVTANTSSDLLAKLNEAYAQKSVRIKEVRERITTFEDERIVSRDGDSP